MQHGSSSIDSKTSFFDNFAAASTAAANTDSSITFFMCIWRNNVQLRKAHIIRQLQHEHTTINTKFNRNNEKVTDIPDWKPITWRLSFSYEFVPEKWRFRCRYTKYMIIKAFHYFGNLENDLNECHASETNNFTCYQCHVEIEPMTQIGRKTIRLDLLARMVFSRMYHVHLQ